MANTTWTRLFLLVIMLSSTVGSTHPVSALVAPSISGRGGVTPPLPDVVRPPVFPTESLTATPTKPPAPLIRLLFTGDINPGRCPAQRAIQKGDFTFPYRFVADKLRAADITIGSLDGTISDLYAPMPCADVQLNLIGPARSVEGLQFAGFDLITVATNHIKDCTPIGGFCENGAFFDTLRNLSSAGILTTGAGENLAQARKPVIIERQGIRFAFLGVSAINATTWADDANPGSAPLSESTINAVVADIIAARSMADVVIVMPHWGVEYETMPRMIQLNWAKKMMDAGATLVIGNHPHVVQPVETFPGGVVAYALGNFVFDQDPRITRKGIVFEAVFRGSKLESWNLLPLHIYNLSQPRWAVSPEAEEILQRVKTGTMMLPAR